MDKHGCGSVDKVKRRKCKGENSGSNIGGDESADKKVPEPMGLRKKDKSLYKCSHCFLIHTAVDGIMQHLLTHQTKTSGILETEKRKTKEKNLPTCKVIITRCNNLYSSYQSIGTDHTLPTNIQGGDAIDGKGKALPKSDGLEKGKTNSLLEKAHSRSSPKQTLNSGITTKVGMKTHKCQLCSKSFGNRHVLEAHIRTHTGERPYRCQLCSKSFARQGYLKKHIPTHTGERPHRCQLCSKSFARQGDLQSHIQTHTGERPHRCQLCSKSFTQQGSLNTHIRTHTGERPHSCLLCTKSFGERRGLKRHIRTHDGEQPQ